MGILSFSESQEINQAISDTQPKTISVKAIRNALANIIQSDVFSQADYIEISKLAPIFGDDINMCACVYLGYLNKKNPDHKYVDAIASTLEETRLSGSGNSETAQASIGLIISAYELARVLDTFDTARIFSWIAKNVNIGTTAEIKQSIEKINDVIGAKSGIRYLNEADV